MTTAESLLAEYGVEIVPANVAPRPMQTRAPKTIERILRRHGEAHTRIMLTTLVETANNGLVLDEVGFWMTSDMVKACETIVEKRTEDWLELWDAMPLDQLQEACTGLYGKVPLRFALGGMVWERIVRRFGMDQLDLLDDRRMAP